VEIEMSETLFPKLPNIKDLPEVPSKNEVPTPPDVIPLPPPPLVSLTNEEWYEILRDLEMHHGVFYKLWEMGKPVFTMQIDTAAVAFNKGGDFVQFVFNPIFWLKCTPYERLFVICHEALHVILNHGVRMKDTTDRPGCNIALDVVVNHMLTRCFGFDRTRISNWEKLCWVDTVFAKGDGKIKTDKGKPIAEDDSFEYYLNMLEKHGMPKCGKGKQGQGQPCQGMSGGGGKGQGDEDGDGSGDGLQTLDDHDVTGGDQNAWDEVIDRLDEGLSTEEKETIKNELNKHFQPTPSQKAGTGTGGMWHIAQVKKAKKKQKWETVIKNWVRKKMRETDADMEQWAMLNRRLVFLPKDMFIPSNMEKEERVKDKHKINVRFYLDTSGSCWHLKDRFFTAAMSIPPDRFNVELFCFDTTVVPTDIVGKKMYGGGGTSFSIIEADIQRAMTNKDGDGKYPDAVFVMTDGYGNRVTPQMPERWYWFLDGGMTEKGLCPTYCPAECNVFKLSDFE
jgi:predicted metal-dependent peptidase